MEQRKAKDAKREVAKKIAGIQIANERLSLVRNFPLGSRVDETERQTLIRRGGQAVQFCLACQFDGLCVG